MSNVVWNDDFLNRMRLEGDAVADRVIDEIFQQGDLAAVNKAMAALICNDGIPAPSLPVGIRDYLITTAELPQVDQEKLLAGQRVFELYGPEILAILGFYSLPAAYAARKGVQVLYRTAYLLKRPVRRVFETAQMIVDVLVDGGLAPGGRGVRTTQKVRLMHGAVRKLTLKNPQQPWDMGLGLPLNQEDLAGTLMTFSYLVLNGLERLNVELTTYQKESYLHCWQIVGHVIGIRPELIPDSLEDAEKLTRIIYDRQVAFSEEGCALTHALIEGMQEIIPDRIFEGLPPSMIHYFLNKDPITGKNIADMLRVPPANWTESALLALRALDTFTGWLSHESNFAIRAMRFFSRSFTEGLLRVERGGSRPPFFVPDSLQALWKLNPKPGVVRG